MRTSRVAVVQKEVVVSSSPIGQVAPVPEHLHTVTPRLIVRDGAAAMDCYRRAFGAEQLGEPFSDQSGTLIHAELRIGDSVVMLTEYAEHETPATSPDALGGIVSAIMATYWGTSTSREIAPSRPARR